MPVIKVECSAMDIDTKDELLPCDHLDELYSVSELGKIYYRVEVEKQTLELKELISTKFTAKDFVNGIENKLFDELYRDL